MNSAVYTNDDDFNQILLERKKQIFKFKQVEVGMYFNIDEANDKFLCKITKIDSKNYQITYVDLSYPEEKRKEKTYGSLYIPPNLFWIIQDLDKQIVKGVVFRQIDDNQIMQLFNTTDFEKSLFHKLHIKSLEKIISVIKNELNNLKTQFDKNVFLNTDTKRILRLKNYIKYLRKLLEDNNIKFRESSEFEENKMIIGNTKLSDLSEKEAIQRLYDNLEIQKNKTKKYQDLYFEQLRNNK